MQNKDLQRLGLLNSRYWSDTFKLLLIHPVFVDDVQAIRRMFGIPKRGYRYSAASAKRWEEKMMLETEKYYSSVGYAKARNKAWQDMANGKINFFEYKKIEDQLNQEAFSNNFQKHIELVLRRFDLPLPIKEAIKKYVIFGISKGLSFVFRGYDASMQFDDDNKMDHMRLRIFDHLSDEEWANLRAFTENTLASALKKRQKLMMPIHNLDRDLEVLSLLRQGKSSRDVASEYWDSDDVDLRDLGKIERAKAVTVRQAKIRIKSHLLKRFPGVTLLP